MNDKGRILVHVLNGHPIRKYNAQLGSSGIENEKFII